VQGGGHDPGADAGQQRHELVRFLADATADDEQVGGQQRLHVPQVLVDPAGPFAPAQVVQFLGVLGGAFLRVVTADFHVAELGIRHQLAVEEQRAADPGAERQHQDRPALAHPGAERHLGHPGRVGIVEHLDRVTGGLAEKLARVQADPGRIEVGGRPGHAAGHHAGECYADQAGPAEEGGQLMYHLGYRVGHGWTWGIDLLAGRQQLSRGDVDGCRLDARAAYIDAECMHGASVAALGFGWAAAVGYCHY
jgi:hypothetical protein